MKLRIKRSKDRQFFFTLEASNGNTVMTSETYTRKPLGMVKKLQGKISGAKIIDDTVKKA